MKKVKDFFVNYKSDILNVLGVVALIAVVVVGVVLFVGKDDDEPDKVGGTNESTSVITTSAETTTAAPETTTAAPETTTKAPVTTTKPRVTTTKAQDPTKAPNVQNLNEGTLPAALENNNADYSHEMKLDAYNGDAKTMEAYNDAISKGAKPEREFNERSGKYGPYFVKTDYPAPYNEIVLCRRCGKPTGSGTHGTCAQYARDGECNICAAPVKGGGCHSCKY